MILHRKVPLCLRLAKRGTYQLFYRYKSEVLILKTTIINLNSI